MAGPAEEMGRAFSDAFVHADRDAFLGLIHPQIEMYLPRSVLEGGAPYRGLSGAERAWADAFDLWEKFETEVRGVDVFGDVFIAHYRVRCFPHREGPPVEYEGHYVTELLDGKIVYSRPYLERDEAQRDAESRSAQRSGGK
jgi:ketosteroid isomerase-like protein